MQTAAETRLLAVMNIYTKKLGDKRRLLSAQEDHLQRGRDREEEEKQRRKKKKKYSDEMFVHKMIMMSV